MACPKRPKYGGRKKGTPNKRTLRTIEVRDAILSALERAGGEDYLLGLARSDPATFLGLVKHVTIGAARELKLSGVVEVETVERDFAARGD